MSVRADACCVNDNDNDNNDCSRKQESEMCKNDDSSITRFVLVRFAVHARLEYTNAQTNERTKVHVNITHSP